MRTNFAAVRASRIPQALGKDSKDGPSLASYVNEAQIRLLQAAGEAGWWGTWARMAFTVSQDDPFITVPREVARLIDVDVCRTPPHSEPVLRIPSVRGGRTACFARSQQKQRVSSWGV